MSEKLNEMKEHLIDGVKYREVERMAEVGEKVLVTKMDGDEIHFVTEVYEVAHDISQIYIEPGWKGDDNVDTNFDCAYVVLEPVAEAPASVSSPDLLDLVSRLIAKVARLEDELDTVRKNVQTFAEQTESNAGDIRMLDERTQVLNAIQAFYTEGER